MSVVQETTSKALPVVGAEISFGTLSPDFDYLDVYVDPLTATGRIAWRIDGTLPGAAPELIRESLPIPSGQGPYLPFGPIQMIAGTTYEIKGIAVDVPCPAIVAGFAGSNAQVDSGVPDVATGSFTLNTSTETVFATVPIFHTQWQVEVDPNGSASTASTWRLYGIITGAGGTVRAQIAIGQFGEVTTSTKPYNVISTANDPLGSPLGRARGAGSYQVTGISLNAAGSTGPISATLAGFDANLDIAGGVPSVLNGDVIGPLLANTVVKLQHSPVSPVAPLFGQTLVWNGTVWLPTMMASPSQTQIVYVRKSGSDITGNGTENNPYLTIAHALSTILDASVNKRYVILLGPGQYADPFLIKPWVGVTAEANTTSGFFSVTEITAPADTCGFDPSWSTSGFSVSWYTSLTFSNHQTWDQLTVPGARPQLTYQDCDFNGGATYNGPGTAGVDNITWDNCLSYGGVTVKGWQFFFCVGGTQFLGGTISILSPPPGALENTMLLAMNTAIGAGFNPTNVLIQWAAPSPVGFLATGDLSNSAIMGTLTLDGAHTSFKATAGGIPPTVTLLNGAPGPVLETSANGLGYSTANISPAPTTLAASQSTQIAIDSHRSPVRTVTANYVIDSAGFDETIFSNPPAVPITITLPLSASWPGREIKVKDISAAPGGNRFVIAASVGDLVEENPTLSENTQLAAFLLKSDGAGNWWVV